MSTHKPISPEAKLLEIADVFLFSVTTRGTVDYNPTDQANSEILATQRLRLEEKAHYQERIAVEDRDDRWLVIRFFVDAQVLILKKGTELKPEDWKEDEAIATFKHVFAADYRWLGEGTPGPEVLSGFANNVIYHVWPYWREAIHADCARMRMLPVTLPMMKTTAFLKPVDHVALEPASSATQ